MCCASIAGEYANKLVCSNHIYCGLLPFIIDGEITCENCDYIFVPDVKKLVSEKATELKAYIVGKDMKEFTLKLGDLTDDERKIILSGCLINFYRG